MLATIGPLAAETGGGIGISGVDEGSFLTIVAVAALAALTVSLLGKRIAVPVVVVEIVLGIIVGPRASRPGRARRVHAVLREPGPRDAVLLRGLRDRLSSGSAGSPLRLGGIGWLLSLAIAFGLGGLLAAAGVVLSLALHRRRHGHHGRSAP